MENPKKAIPRHDDNTPLPEERTRWRKNLEKWGAPAVGVVFVFFLGRMSSCFEDIASLKTTTEILSKNVEKIDGKIDTNFSTLDEKIGSNFTTLDGKIEGIGSRVDGLYDLVLERFGLAPRRTVPADAADSDPQG